MHNPPDEIAAARSADCYIHLRSAWPLEGRCGCDPVLQVCSAGRIAIEAVAATLGRFDSKISASLHF